MVDQESHGPHQGGGRRLAAAHEHVEQDALKRLEALKRFFAVLSSDLLCEILFA